MSLIGSTFAKNNVILNQSITRAPFWDSQHIQYSKLNSVKIPTANEIRNYQLSKVQQYEKTVKRNKFASLKSIGTDNLTQVLQSFKSEENKQLSELVTNFVSIANRFYRYGHTRVQAQQAWKAAQTNLKLLRASLEKIQNELNMNNNIVLGNYLKELQNTLKLCDIDSPSYEALKAFSNRINLLKGDVLEEMGVAWLNQLNIPKVTTIRTGNISLRTNQKNRHSGQIIQDIMQLRMDFPDIDNILIEYQPIGSTKMIKMPVKEFLKYMNSVSGDSKQIILSDEGYSNLLKLSQLNIQAKSGLKQALWNQAKYNQVSINEYKKDDLVLTTKETFKLLQSLNKEENSIFKVKDTSKDYNALANYGLGTVLIKVLHLSANEGNQYVLTPAGFTPFSVRLAQLMRENQYIALLQDNIILNNNTLTQKHNVAIKET